MVTITRNSRDYIDVDFAFGAHPTTNNINIKKTINAVKQSVLNLLLLKRGDKPFHPEIESPIGGYLFENDNVVSRVVLEDEIRKYLTSYEPRLRINSVQIGYPDPNTINCTVVGSLINLQEPITINLLIDRMR